MDHYIIKSTWLLGDVPKNELRLKFTCFCDAMADNTTKYLLK